jgi:hypothetical protein
MTGSVEVLLRRCFVLEALEPNERGGSKMLYRVVLFVLE